MCEVASSHKINSSHVAVKQYSHQRKKTRKRQKKQHFIQNEFFIILKTISFLTKGSHV